MHQLQLHLFREPHNHQPELLASRITTTDSMGDVHRTDALWNKLACFREPTGSLSEAIYISVNSF